MGDQVKGLLCKLNHQLAATRGMVRYLENHGSAIEELAKQVKMEEITEKALVLTPIQFRDWMGTYERGPLESYSIRKLKALARARKIPNWSRMDKWDLMGVLRNDQENAHR